MSEGRIPRPRTSTKRPSDAEARWWLRIGVGESEVRALLDPGASTTVMGTVGLQLATTLGCKFVVSEKPGVRLPKMQHFVRPHDPTDHGGRTYSGYTSGHYAPFNFVRVFRAVLDPDTVRLFWKEAEAYVKLEVASLMTDPIAVYATGANAASDLQRERLKAKAEKRSPAGLMAR